MPLEQSISASDGLALSTTFFEASQPNGTVVLINSAMGVHRRYYAKYAQFLADSGFHVLTYDYRGIGDSPNPAGKATQIWHWGALDQSAMLNWLAACYPQSSIALVGHSMGGQIIGLTAEHSKIQAFLGVGSQNGYYGNWQGIGQGLIFGFWSYLVPLTCRITGHLPKQLLGGTEDVPAGVALDWAQSGRRKRYLFDTYAETDHNHFERVSLPMRLYSFEDDLYAPRPTVAAMRDLYKNAEIELRHLAPHDIQVSKIGHFGFFRSVFEQTLWQESAEWLARD